MVHLWQHHRGTPGRGRYHNQEWAEKMIEIGLMPTDTGKPGGRITGDHMADPISVHPGIPQAARHGLLDVPKGV